MTSLRKSRVAEELQEEQNLKLLEKIRSVKAATDVSPPVIYPHIELRQRKLQIARERIDQVDRENRRLMKAIIETMDRPGRLDNYNVTEQHISMVPANNRKRENLRIVKKNEEIVGKLMKVRPTIDRSTLEMEWLAREEKLKSLSKFEHPWRKANSYTNRARESQSEPAKADRKPLESRKKMAKKQRNKVLKEQIATIDAISKLPPILPTPTNEPKSNSAAGNSRQTVVTPKRGRSFDSAVKLSLLDLAEP